MLSKKQNLLLTTVSICIVTFFLSFLLHPLFLLIPIAYILLTYILPLVNILQNKYRIEIIDGDSMYPALPRGIHLTIGICNPKTINKYDTVTFYHSQDCEPNHRVIGEPLDGYVYIHGDNVEKPDGAVSVDDIRTKSIQIGLQPIFIPLTYLSMIDTIIKLKWIITRSNKAKIKKSIRKRELD